MNVLCIDTSQERIGLALFFCERKYFLTGETGAKRHNTELLSLIDRILTENGASLAEMGAFSVVTGPGSFTGIRIGVATVNAFALALAKPVVEVTYLEQFDDGTEKLVLLDCRNRNYYAGLFLDGKVSYLALSEDEIKEYDVPKHYAEGTAPALLLQKTLEKIEKGEFSPKAKPFYLKRSSAERETGVEV